MSTEIRYGIEALTTSGHITLVTGLRDRGAAEREMNTLATALTVAENGRTVFMSKNGYILRVSEVIGACIYTYSEYDDTVPATVTGHTYPLEMYIDDGSWADTITREESDE